MRIRFVLFVLVFLATTAFSNCENKFFSFSVKDAGDSGVTTLDILENITDECKMTMVFKDEDVKPLLDKKLNYHICRYSLAQ